MGQGMLIINLEGTLLLSESNDSHIVGPSIIGESCFLFNSNWPYDVEAQSEGTCLRLTQE